MLALAFVIINILSQWKTKWNLNILKEVLKFFYVSIVDSTDNNNIEKLSEKLIVESYILAYYQIYNTIEGTLISF